MPGGKKAQCAEEMAKHFHWENINVGDLLRKEVSKKSDRGARINESFKKCRFGKSCNRQYLNLFSDDELVIEIVKEHIEQAEKIKKSWIVTGFPRTKV